MTQNNPPAFPVVGKGIDEPWRGMSLRDYFAAAALQGIWASGNPDDTTYYQDACNAYAAADAMLKARNP